MLPVEQTTHVALRVYEPTHNVSRFLNTRRCGLARHYERNVHIICPVDGTTTEQRTSHLSAYFRSETQLYSSDYAASYAVEFLMFTH
jgi:hypothetical protein